MCCQLLTYLFIFQLQFPPHSVTLLLFFVLYVSITKSIPFILKKINKVNADSMYHYNIIWQPPGGKKELGCFLIWCGLGFLVGVTDSYSTST